MIGHEFVCELYNTPRSILHPLGFILNRDVVARTLAEKILHSISALANDNKTVAYPCVAQSFDAVLQAWSSPYLAHRLGKRSGKLAHPCSAARREDYSFFASSHRPKAAHASRLR